MATLSRKTSRPLPAVVELHCADNEGKVRVVLPDKHIMAMSVTTAVEACRAYNEQALFKDQFEQLLDRLASWLKERRSNISQAYLTTRDAGLLFLVVREEKSFSPEFEDTLTDLDIEIANEEDFNLIGLSVLALPPSSKETVESFLSDSLRFHYVRNGN